MENMIKYLASMLSDSVLFGLSQLCLTLAEFAFLQLLQIPEIIQFTNMIFETVGRMRLIFIPLDFSRLH